MAEFPDCAPDIATAEACRARLDALLSDGPVEIDATGWAETDIAGLGVLAAGFATALAQGQSLSVRLPETGGLRTTLARAGFSPTQLDVEGDLWRGFAA